MKISLNHFIILKWPNKTFSKILESTNKIHFPTRPFAPNRKFFTFNIHLQTILNLSYEKNLSPIVDFYILLHFWPKEKGSRDN
jgi:hypothetical protein